MSHTTYTANYSTKAVCKQCCRSTCCLYMGSDLCYLLADHKIELFLFVFTNAWFITNTVLFAILVHSDKCASFRSDILLAFGGLALCLPATIYLVIMSVTFVMYCIKMYKASREEIRRQRYEEHYELDTDNSDPVVHIFTDSVNENL